MVDRGGGGVDVHFLQRHRVDDRDAAGVAQRDIGAGAVRRQRHGTGRWPGDAGRNLDFRGQLVRRLVDGGDLLAAQRRKDIAVLRFELGCVAGLVFQHPVSAAGAILLPGDGDGGGSQDDTLWHFDPQVGVATGEDVGAGHFHEAAVRHAELDDRIPEITADALVGGRARIGVGETHAGQVEHRTIDRIELQPCRGNRRLAAGPASGHGVVEEGFEIGDAILIERHQVVLDQQGAIFLDRGNLQIAGADLQGQPEQATGIQLGANCRSRRAHRHDADRGARIQAQRHGQVDAAANLAE